MPYTVAFSEKDGIVYVRISGATSKEDHYAARDEAFRLCQQHGCARLLVDLRELDTSEFSTTRCFAFGESTARTPPYARIAHVLPPSGKSRADVRFTSTVEANRGKPTGEFETTEEARRWLLEQA
jgi:hypothetical protein